MQMFLPGPKPAFRRMFWHFKHPLAAKARKPCKQKISKSHKANNHTSFAESGFPVIFQSLERKTPSCGARYRSLNAKLTGVCLVDASLALCNAAIEIVRCLNAHGANFCRGSSA